MLLIIIIFNFIARKIVKVFMRTLCCLVNYQDLQNIVYIINILHMLIDSYHKCQSSFSKSIDSTLRSLNILLCLFHSV